MTGFGDRARTLAVLGLASLFVANTAGATALDLTYVGAEEALGDAIFRQIDNQSTGTGVIDPFVQLGDNSGSTSGYNTTVNMTLDNGSAANFNHAITVGEIPIVEIDGMFYREFVLDINESDGGPADDRFVSLDDVQIFLGGTANGSFDTFDMNGVLEHDGVLTYRLDDGADNWVALDFQLNSGSGSGDMYLYVLSSLFGMDDTVNVVLYSEFGLQGVDPAGFTGNFGTSDGFEEWALREPTPTTQVPEPATMTMLSLGLIGLALRRRTRS